MKEHYVELRDIRYASLENLLKKAIDIIAILDRKHKSNYGSNGIFYLYPVTRIETALSLQFKLYLH